MRHEIKTGGLSAADSKRALCEAYEVYSKQYVQYKPSLSWKSEHLAELSFNVKGYRIHGHVLADDGRLVLEVTLPWIARPFQGQAISIIENEVQIWVKKISSASLNESV